MADKESGNNLNFRPDADFLRNIEAEAAIEGCEPAVVVARAVSCYLEIASQMRTGAKLVLLHPLDMDVPDDRVDIWGGATVGEIELPWPLETEPDKPEGS